ncbi:MAG: hypothetical protein O2875_06500 [Planctomycetota bacterium]|nr:hypothetical protein [Planctomycetota bacterium]MDA1262702.1 hypothetical protein [Planctomycetota bacterium]
MRDRPLSFPLIVPLAAGAMLQATAQGACPGDINGDLQVDAVDLTILLSNWAGTGQADLNLDGFVDGEDLSILVSLWGQVCQPPQPSAETLLACVPLTAAPYASFVQTFIAGTTVTIAVDPGLTAIQVGATADFFVVAERTSSEWAANNLLTDVRGTSQPITFAAGGIAANRFTVTGGSTLSGDGGLSVGRGYDLVIDMDQNGQFSIGDLIDGGDDRAGLWISRDPTATGPLAVTTLSSYTASGATSGFTLARLWYPTTVASMTPRPLVVISHGNGHQYSWYDYLGTHLASWGYIVISHQNNTVPGIETSSTTSLQHTSAIIAQQATVASGAINGKIDASRISWIGHSRGGEGIVRAYDRIFDATYTPTGYGLSNIKFLCPIAPTDFLGVNSSNPHAANFMLLWGAADGDVSGTPTNSIAWSFDLAERSVGFRNTVYVHGADHNDFNCCGTNDFVGPSGTAILNAGAQAVAKAFILAGIKYHIEGESAMKEFMWRPSSTLRPTGVATTTTLVKELVPAPSASVKSIDTFQTQTSTTLSSCGGAVVSTVSNISEALARETDGTFTWSTGNPHNGSTRTKASDTQRMVAWDWNSAQNMEWAVPVSLGDVSAMDFIEVRVGQGTRHPNTVSLNGGATFSIVLRDAAGVEVRVSSSAQGEAVNRPYQRTGSGTGAGWQNELRTIRLRLRDFQSGGTGINLGQIVAIRIEVGGTAGSATGRFILDDLQFTKE